MTFSEHKDEIGNLIFRVGRVQTQSPRQMEQIGITIEALRSIMDETEKFDFRTPTSRNGTGRYFEQALNKAVTLDAQLEYLFQFMVRCLREEYLRVLAPERPIFGRAMEYFDEKSVASFGPLSQEDIRERDYLFHGMPKFVFFSFGNQLVDWENRAKDRFEAFSSRAENLEKALQKAEEKVKNYEAQYNFVGLAGAFKSLGDKKKDEVKNTKMYCVYIALTMLSIPYIELMSAAALDKPFLKWDIATLPIAVPLFIIELFLLYHFRILLRNYDSAKAQLLQLELRFAVCAFIQSYSDFSKNIDGKKLERFESLIFSGIVTEPSKIPSTFDGVEQLAKLISEVRGKST